MTTPRPSKDLPATLREARLAARLSMRQLAERVGVDHAYIVRLEAGKHAHPSADVLQRMADALGLDPAKLLHFIGVKPASTLPAPRTYFRRKLGVDAEEADILAQLIEDYQERKKGGEP